MNPVSAHASGYRSYGEVDLDFPVGCTAILGPNGAGKSSLLELVPLALFGSPTRSLSDYLNTDEDDLLIELQFEHAGELYRVRRTYSAKGRGKTTVDLEKAVPDYDESNLRAGVALARQGIDPGLYYDRWEPLTRETAAATQTLIEEIIGLSRETFLASAHLSQGDGDRFTAAQPRDRKAILAEILNLGLWDRLLVHARVELRTAEDAIVAIRARVDALEVEVAAAADVPTDLAAARRDVADARERQVYFEGILDRAQQAVADNAAAAERLRTLEVETRVAREALQLARQAHATALAAGEQRILRQVEFDQAAELAEQVPLLETELAMAREAMANAIRRQDLIRQASDRKTQQTRLGEQLLALRDHASTLAGKADHLEQHIDESALCDRCGQTLGAEAAARAVASFRAEALEAQARAAGLEQDNHRELDTIAALLGEANQISYDKSLRAPDVIESALAAARAAVARQAVLAEQVRTLAEQAARQDELALALADTADAATAARTALDEATEGVVDEAQLQQAVTDARAGVQSAAATVETRRAIVTRLEVAEQRAQAAAVELAEGVAAAGEFQRQIDILKLAEKAYGRDGIPALILESSAIPTIEVEANRILGELGTPFHVELRTQRTLKTSDSLRETLEIVVYDGNDARAYETFSGGEKTRINLALRLALAGLLAHRRGAESRLLAIDEPDGLDAAGMEALAEVLRGLSGSFERILVVSHQPQLGAAFDQVIAVDKADGRSRIVADREPVTV